MPDLTQALMKMKQFIDQSKTEAAQIQGQITQLEAQRSSEFAVSTDAEAETYIKELEADVARMEQELQDGVQVVKEGLGWQ